MLTRTKRKLNVALADERTNEQVEWPVEVYWSETKDFITDESIARAAAAEASIIGSKGARRFIPLGVV